MDKEVKFSNAKEMFDYICEDNDIYTEDGIYLFRYNEDDAICMYHIDKEHALELSKKSLENDEYWGAFLGVGGYIYDAPSNLELCEELVNENHVWVDTKDYPVARLNISTTIKEDGTLLIFYGNSIVAEVADGKESDDFIEEILNGMGYIWNKDGTIRRAK